MEIKEILKKVKPLVDKIEKEHEIEIIIKQYVETGMPKDMIKELAKDEKEAEKFNNQFAPIFTVGWKKKIDDEHYGNFLVNHQVSSDCENAHKITFGDDKADDKVVEEMILLCEKDYVKFSQQKLK